MEVFAARISRVRNCLYGLLGVLPKSDSRPSSPCRGKETGKTNHIERLNNTFRQRISRLLRKSLSFWTVVTKNAFKLDLGNHTATINHLTAGLFGRRGYLPQRITIPSGPICKRSASTFKNCSRYPWAACCILACSTGSGFCCKAIWFVAMNIPRIANCS